MKNQENYSEEILRSIAERYHTEGLHNAEKLLYRMLINCANKEGDMDFEQMEIITHELVHLLKFIRSNFSYEKNKKSSNGLRAGELSYPEVTG